MPAEMIGQQPYLRSLGGPGNRGRSPSTYHFPHPQIGGTIGTLRDARLDTPISRPLGSELGKNMSTFDISEQGQLAFYWSLRRQCDGICRKYTSLGLNSRPSCHGDAGWIECCSFDSRS